MQQTSISRYAERYGSYRLVAAEYYDASLHPTCANFRSASRLALQRHASAFQQPRATILEVGAGRSIHAEICTNWRQLRQRLILNDAAQEMLAYSADVIKDGAETIIGNVADISIQSGSIDCIISSLGDPYNDDRFWLTCYNALRLSGFIIYTTPAFGWASKFRNADSHSKFAAEFVTMLGQKIDMPSFIYNQTEQIKMIQKVGFSVTSFGSINLHEISHQNISPKLNVLNDPYLPIIDWYICKK